MLRKIVIIASMVFFVGCDHPGVTVDPIDSPVLVDDVNSFVYISSNAYDAIPIESYEISYKDGVFLKEQVVYKASVIPSGFGTMEGNDTIQVGFLHHVYFTTDFISYMTIFHLDSNRTYTIAGFSEEMDREYNISVGNRVDSYSVGDSQILKASFVKRFRTDITKIDINETGGFKFSEIEMRYDN